MNNSLVTNKANLKRAQIPAQLGFAMLEVAELLKIARKANGIQNKGGKQYVVDFEGRRILL